MKTYFLALLALTPAAMAAAQSIDQPAIASGDRWIYRQTTEKGQGWNQTSEEMQVTRVTASSLYITTKTAGSTLASRDIVVGRDWSRVRDVNGKETTINQPLSFPLTPGKSWDLSYEEKKPNAAHKLERFENRFVVVGYEDVSVPAGKFRALKIESEGVWHAVIEPAQTVTQGAQSNSNSTTLVSETQKVAEREVSGKTYKAFWYVPEVERWVKSVEEYYSTSGIRNERYTQELESFKHAE